MHESLVWDAVYLPSMGVALWGDAVLYSMSPAGRGLRAVRKLRLSVDGEGCASIMKGPQLNYFIEIELRKQ